MERDFGTVENIFHAYQKDRTAIYGLSPLTAELLKQLNGHQVIGLLDGCRTSGSLYGKPILSIEEAIAEDIRLIIVAARPESCKIIAKRIGELCRKSGIKLIDIHGRDLNAPPKAAYAFVSAAGMTKHKLRGLIDAHDVISVDLFDTLVMRRTLFSADVYEIVDLRLRERGIALEGFPQRRLEAEKELCKSTFPTLLEIYQYMLRKYALAGVQAEELARIEWETERDLAVPREELCGLLSAVCREGKPVYLVSDTFCPKEQLAELLEYCGFTGYTDILASCEYRTGKTQQLFEKLREKIPGKTCLHIGDSRDADIESAERNGFTACHLYSGLDLFEKVGYLGLWEQIGGLSGRIQAGMLVSKLFNSPFQFEEPESKLHVDTAYDIGYLFFGPVIAGFVIWLRRQIREHGLKNIWFGARDGYLIKRLYEQIDPTANAIYFLTSRFAAVRAGMENEEDIRYVEEMRFSGSLQEHLRERFGICVEGDDGRHSLLDYREEIFQAAAVNRKNYQKYLSTLQLEEGDIAFFDFVARGTVQAYIQRLTDRHLRGFYFWQQDEKYMEKLGLDVQAFYAPEEDSIAQSYLALEPVLMSPQPSVVGFDEAGAAVFAREERTERELQSAKSVQDGISDYFQTYRKLDPAWENRGERPLEACIFSLISMIEVRDKEFLSIKDDDMFFNRVTEISELL